jgi:hypothetical protein
VIHAFIAFTHSYTTAPDVYPTKRHPVFAEIFTFVFIIVTQSNPRAKKCTYNGR